MSATVVGQSVPRLAGRDLVTGRAVYTADMRWPGMLYARTKRSDYAHALIKRIEVEEAARLPGVAAVLTAEDIPGENSMGIIIMDHQLLARERVRYRGENLALVVGDKEVLDEALELIRVEYEPLPVVLDPLEALAEGAPRIHERGNLTWECHLVKGDVEAAFARCDVVVEGTYRTGFQEHAYLEPEAVVAVPEAGGRVTIYCGCQTPFHIRSIVARALGVPFTSVRVVQATTGGSFGGKDEVDAEMGALAALAALRTGRPVMINHTREEAVMGASVRHAAIIRHRTGATRDGRILARDVDVVLDGGAYSSLSPFVAVKALAHSAGPYDVPNVRARVRVAYTNKTYAGACRGFGVPQVTFAAERQMDELARELGMDRMELRLKNAVRVGSSTAFGQVLRAGVGLEETIRQAAAVAGWKERRAGTGSGGRVRRGIGMACMMQGVSNGAEGVDAVGAFCQLAPDGSVLVGCGLADMGQGANTVFAQIASQILGVPLERVRVRAVDTDHTPDSGPTVASRATTMGGRAVAMAAEKARDKVVEMAASMLEVAPADLDLRDGMVVVKDAPDRAVPLAQVVNALYWTGQPINFEAWSKAPDARFDEQTHQGDIYVEFGYGTHVMEVEVDTETGKVTILRHVAAHDVGKAINRQAVEGQIEGGSLMGIGLGLLEEIKYDERGNLLNPNFTDYLVPTSADAPDTEPVIVEDPGAWGPFGAKGVGEFPVSAAAAALANAVSDALGVPVRQLPVSPEYVLDLLSSQGQEPRA